MECELTHRNVRILSRAIQCLSKFGDEIYLKATDSNVLFQAVNLNKSVIAKFNFSKSFFKVFKLINSDSENQDQVCSCHLSIKALMMIFKTPIIDKSAEKCSIEFDEQHNKFTILMHCRYSVLKTYNLPVLSVEPIDITPESEELTSVIYSQSRILLNALSTFNKSVDEVTMIAKQDKLTFHNFSEGMLDCSNCMLTEIETGSREFGKYLINHNDPLTFTLKELKSILAFSDATLQEIEMFFASHGKPILITLTSDSTYKVHCFLATLESSSILALTTDTPPILPPPRMPHELSSDDSDEHIDQQFNPNIKNCEHQLHSNSGLCEDLTIPLVNGNYHTTPILQHTISNVSAILKTPVNPDCQLEAVATTPVIQSALENDSNTFRWNRSPPAKRFRFEVLRDIGMIAIDSPFNGNTPPQVLAPDSDEEN